MDDAMGLGRTPENSDATGDVYTDNTAVSEENENTDAADVQVTEENQEIETQAPQTPADGATQANYAPQESDATQAFGAAQDNNTPQDGYATQNYTPAGNPEQQGFYPPQGNYISQENYNPNGNYGQQGWYNPQENYAPQGDYNQGGNYGQQGYYPPQDNYNSFNNADYQPGYTDENPEPVKKNRKPIITVAIVLAAVAVLAAAAFGVYRGMFYVSRETMVGSWVTVGEKSTVVSFYADGTCDFGDLAGYASDEYGDFLGGLIESLIQFEWTLDSDKNLTISIDTFLINESMAFEVHRTGSKLTLVNYDTDTGEPVELVLQKVG